MTTTLKTPAGDMLHNVTIEDVRALHAAQVERYGADAAEDATRVETHALLQLQCPAPEEGAVTDAHRIESDRARKSDPNHTDALHWLQKQHGKSLWVETDRLIALTKGGN